MQELLVQIFSYIRGIWLRRWPMLLTAWVVCAVGWVVVLKMPDQYESSAKVYVDTKSVLQPLLRGIAIQGDINQQVALMSRTLFSRPNLEKVARMTDLDLQVSNDSQMDQLLASIKDNATMSAARRQNIFTITFVNNDPEVAKKVVQAFLTVFVESSLGSSRKDSNVAQRFLDEQIKEYEARLDEAENKVKLFKQENIGLMPGSGADYFSRLEQQKAKLKFEKDRLEELQNSRDELSRQMKKEKPTIGLSPTANIFGDGVAHPLDARILDTEARLDELLLQYTDKHPDVIALKEVLVKLTEQRAMDLEKAKEEIPEVADATPLQQNPVYQQLKIALTQTDAEIITIETRINKIAVDVRELESLVDTVPEVEAEMKRLNRDYNIVKKNYEQLLSRRESARVAQDADATGDSVKFDVIEPPRVPMLPTGPNRPLFLFAVLIAGIGAGGGLAFFLSQLKLTFYTRGELRDAFDIPVLGSVSMDWSDKKRIKRRIEIGVFMSASAFLLFAFAVVVLLQERLSGLVNKLTAVI